MCSINTNYLIGRASAQCESDHALCALDVANVRKILIRTNADTIFKHRLEQVFIVYAVRTRGGLSGGLGNDNTLPFSLGPVFVLPVFRHPVISQK